MKSFDKWLENKETDSLPPEKTNKQGGFEPETDIQRKKWKKVDLISLPSNISGTNCFNCSYVAKKSKNVGFCTYKDILDWVTPRMCCSFWTHKDVKRNF